VLVVNSPSFALRIPDQRFWLSPGRVPLSIPFQLELAPLRPQNRSAPLISPRRSRVSHITASALVTITARPPAATSPPPPSSPCTKEKRDEEGGGGRAGGRAGGRGGGESGRKKRERIMNEHRRAPQEMTHSLYSAALPPPRPRSRWAAACIYIRASSVAASFTRAARTCTTARRARASPSRCSKFSRRSCRVESAGPSTAFVARAFARSRSDDDFVTRFTKGAGRGER